MARRKKKEEETDWTPPEFDEVGYMRQEIEGARAAVATIGWAVVGAIVSFLLYSVYAPLAFFAGIAVGFGLYFVLPVMGIKTDAFKRRDWTGHGITFFFSWLAFWIILLNPPFGDFTDPTVQGISVSPFHAGYPGPLLCALPISGTVDLANSASGGNDSLYILFRATDNVGLSVLTVTVKPGSAPQFTPVISPATGLDRCVGAPVGSVLPAGSYYVTIPLGPSLYQVEIKAIDTSGHPTMADFQILAH